MKRFMGTLVIFVIFLGLFAYYFMVETKRKKTGEDKKEVAIFNFKKEEVSNLELTDMEVKLTFILKKDKEWKIEKPRELPASKKALDEIVSELAGLKADREITKNPKSFKSYGLDVPRYKIKFNAGSDVYTLLIGKESPAGNFRFVKEENKNNIYAVDIYRIDKLMKKDLFELRAKELLMIEEGDINKIEVKTKEKKEFIIEKDKEGKWIVADAPGRDLTQNIQNVIDELKNLSVEEFMEDKNLSPGNYGLADFSYSIKIHKYQGEPVLFQFGKEEGNSIYVKKDKENIFYKTGKRVVDSINNLYNKMQEKDEGKNKKRGSRTAHNVR